eukprot:6214780-Pleurochrysis_carterae.AAC.3
MVHTVRCILHLLVLARIRLHHFLGLSANHAAVHAGHPSSPVFLAVRNLSFRLATPFFVALVDASQYGVFETLVIRPRLPFANASTYGLRALLSEPALTPATAKRCLHGHPNARITSICVTLLCIMPTRERVSCRWPRPSR